MSLGKWLYCVGEDASVYVFDVVSGQLESVLQASETAENGETKEVIAVCHHPHRNLLVTITADGQLKIWKP